MTRVLIAAPSAVVRAGLEALVQSTPDLEVAASVSGVDSLSRGLQIPEADVLLVDIDRSGERGLSSMRALSAEPGALAIVVLTGEGGMDTTAALRAGARAVLPREAEAQEIVAAVRAAAAGLVALHPASMESVLEHVPAAALHAETNQGEELSPREIEVLAMLAEGAGNKMIARRLGISEHTVKFHVGSILSKLNASSRTEAVTIGIRQGVIMV